VARQYSGTAGRIENCQIGVFLSYASRWGHALIDRRLYLPQAWAENGARRAKAAIPATTTFATKPAIARDLIAAALDAGVPCAFVLGDALYGSDRRLRRMLEARQQPYVLAVRSNEPMRVGGGALAATTSGLLADALPPDAWACHAAGEGAKGRACMTGRGFGCSGHRIRNGSTGCWCAAAARMRKSGPTTSSSPPLARRSPNWPASPACAGRPRTNSASIIARRALGRHGIGTSRL
jgi:hypothetical protein